MKTVIGIDPGKSGALAAMTQDGHVAILVMPIAGKDIDAVMISDWIKSFLLSKKYSPIFVCIEKVHAMPTQGVTSMFTFGFGVGLIHGILATLGVPFYVIDPKQWQQHVLSFTTKDKNAAIDYVKRAYPDIAITATARSKKPHSGIADAICIAQYGLSKL